MLDKNPYDEIWKAEGPSVSCKQNSSLTVSRGNFSEEYLVGVLLYGRSSGPCVFVPTEKMRTLYEQLKKDFEQQ